MPHNVSALAVFHAFTGSDTTSFCAGISKMTRKTCDVFLDITDVLLVTCWCPSKYIWQHIWRSREMCSSVVWQNLSIDGDKWSIRQHLIERRSRALKKICKSIYYEPHTKQRIFGDNHYTHTDPIIRSPANLGWYQVDSSLKPKCVINWCNVTAKACMSCFANRAMLASSARPYLVVKTMVTKSDCNCVDFIVICTPIHDLYVWSTVSDEYTMLSYTNV